jgi:hypothetical protein
MPRLHFQLTAESCPYPVPETPLRYDDQDDRRPHFLLTSDHRACIHPIQSNPCAATQVARSRANNFPPSAFSRAPLVHPHSKSSYCSIHNRTCSRVTSSAGSNSKCCLPNGLAHFWQLPILPFVDGDATRGHFEVHAVDSIWKSYM